MTDESSKLANALLELLAGIQPEQSPSTPAEPLAEKESERFDQSAAEQNVKLDLKMKSLQAEGLEQDIAARKNYAERIFIVTAVWLAAVLAIVVFSGITIAPPAWYPDWLPTVRPLKLADSVIITLIGSTTANLVGLLLVVMRYLFPNRDNRYK